MQQPGREASSARGPAQMSLLCLGRASRPSPPRHHQPKPRKQGLWHSLGEGASVDHLLQVPRPSPTRGPHNLLEERWLPRKREGQQTPFPPGFT